MRTITGAITLPANTPATKAGQVIIEVRDISLADAPSVVVAEQRLNEVALKPNGQIKFKLPVPEVEANRSLSLRAHVSLDGSDRVDAGDLLTTANYPVPNAGTSAQLKVPVVVI